MELWDAYDREGRVTGGTLIRDEAIPEGLYHLVCEALVRHADGSYLCMQRDFRKPAYPGCWEATAGGSALKGEDALTCVRRELREETGLDCDSFTLVARHVTPGTIYMDYVCTVDVDKASVLLQKGETVAYRWVSEADWPAFLRREKVIPAQLMRYGITVPDN
ncbi:MAG: NUDIX domain-containing protein [Eubacteriales bacterium]|nr:NUDIX domain-containing protein [Eubacteriales bacterium]